jgi:hypothetical protein
MLQLVMRMWVWFDVCMTPGTMKLSV